MRPAVRDQKADMSLAELFSPVDVCENHLARKR
jgi:hypothetical protein